MHGQRRAAYTLIASYYWNAPRVRIKFLTNAGCSNGRIVCKGDSSHTSIILLEVKLVNEPTRVPSYGSAKKPRTLEYIYISVEVHILKRELFTTTPYGANFSGYSQSIPDAGVSIYKLSELHKFAGVQPSRHLLVAVASTLKHSNPNRYFGTSSGAARVRQSVCATHREISPWGVHRWHSTKHNGLFFSN